ncbi:hypothetical protein R3P38DRAFT_3231296 [Favolaschia claudopus]|uniref:FHA domain-containing protein n=1 Tax=Favolaschia claudopus TaxID=2862362 RepID=A0AAV9ZL28_9AGAR
MQASGDASGGRYEQPRLSGSFFPNASQFIINGGHFQSITHIHQTDTSNFRTIPLGDIVLGRNSGVLQVRGYRGATIRRVHSALIDGRNSTTTVAIYEGEEAESVSGASANVSLLSSDNIAIVYYRNGTGISHRI